jgi:capsular exopolysaccharide synthesis family protein
MSRIHDALRRAESLRADRPAEQVPAEVGRTDDGGLELQDLLAKAKTGLDAETQAEISSVSVHEPSTKAPEAVFRTVQWNPDAKRVLFSSRESPAMAKEEFRSLRARFYQILATRPLKVVLVSSALPGEGKSFVSANLAEVLSRHSGRSALLIDGDLRRPQLHRMLGAPSGPGLTDYLQKPNLREHDVVQKGDADGLYFLPCGTETPNSSELLSSPRMKQLVQWARDEFSWVVIDSPPVVLVSDAARLAEFCDGVVLVVQADATSYEIAAKAKSMFRENAVLGAVLNRVPGRNREVAGYYYHGYSDGASR